MAPPTHPFLHREACVCRNWIAELDSKTLCSYDFLKSNKQWRDYMKGQTTRWITTTIK